MQIEIPDQGGFASALVHLKPGESFVSEAGAMYVASDNVDIDVTTRARSSGGILGGLKRLLASESFFLSTYRTTDGRPGHVGLAPVQMGDVLRVDMDGSVPWLCAGGSYLGSASTIDVDSQFQGFKGFFTGESLSFVRLTGAGPFLVSAFGRIVEVEVEGGLTVDTGHVVAYEETLSYSPGKLGGSWLQSFLAGEGVVLHFTGRGRLLVQSHNSDSFGRRVGSMLSPRS
ncbi:TIGR00266 family protein [Paludisphaera rhizosphaerae]|uniref:TIGR00266 family protein n=1 Tax=Paludisphaera rhizosphaerae TaxID=2711216 RepID=UPI0013EB3F02|nr:TIGR00266 family protein [Paludisphaera rhizosphaerae]